MIFAYNERDTYEFFPMEFEAIDDYVSKMDLYR